MTAWPVGVTQAAEVSGYSEKPERNVRQFQPEVGPPMEARRTSIDVDLIQYETPPLTYAEWTTLLDFYRSDCKDGVLPFTRKHPFDLTGGDLNFKFVDVPQFRAVTHDMGRATISLRRLPT